MKNPFCTRRRLWAGAAVLCGVMLFGSAHDPLFRGIASFLIVEDPLEYAAAIVSLGGQLPFREMESAELYRAGWAPQVIIMREAPSPESEALQALQIGKERESDVSIKVLIQQGVPASAIVVPEQEGVGTLEELQAVYAFLEQKNATVILVTSRFHTRRTRLTWHHVTRGQSQPIVRAASGDPFDPERWWHTRRFVLSVVREYLGLINYYAGFPVGG